MITQDETNMKKLAIEGHKTRGNEVIELLEMLGGKNIQRINGALSKCYYIIDNQSISVCMSVEDDYVVYTLEEFKDKFPFKVDDKVRIPEYESKVKIVGMEYFNLESLNKEHVIYKVYRDDKEEYYTEEELLDINDIKDYESCYTKTNDIVDISSRTLGIKGHSSRSEDVKSLLTMLGGRINVENLPFDNDNFILYIGNNKCVYPSTVSSFKGAIYSLEEFETKFPYKVGDKVWLHYENSTVRITEIITHMRWCNKWNCILYDVYTCDNLRESAFTPYKEETITIDDFKANTKEWLIEKLESMSKDNALQSICNIYDELHKPKYPKTYEECCKILVGRKPNPNEISFDKMEICLVDLDNTQNIDFQTLQLFPLNSLFKILICRNAYWKIAGEEMGLGKSWKPDAGKDKYIIRRAINVVIKSYNISSVLEFPTPEIRDTFYDNFKDLIEKCKELL